MVNNNRNKKSKFSQDPEKIADDVAFKVVEMLGKRRFVKHIRHSQFISSTLAAAGLALFLVGVEKVFVQLSGWFSILLGLIFLAISGALFKKL